MSQRITMPTDADEVVTAEEIALALDRLAGDIDRHYNGEEILLLVVLIGGMIPAAQLALRLKTPITVDYVHATRYRGEEGQDQLDWIAMPRSSLKGERVLIVDDILDEGPTLKAVKAWCASQGAHSVDTAVLADKPHGRRVEGIQADFVGTVVPDRYVFGFGMDYRGGLRHLPSIYALAEKNPASD